MRGITSRLAAGAKAMSAGHRLRNALSLFLILAAATAAAEPPIEIWLSDGVGRFGDVTFYALGGRHTHPTPRGTFTIKAKKEDFYSNKYKAPMPLSMFFTDQCAIHVGSLREKSHGCVHVDWQTAEYLYYYAKSGKTKVKIYP